MFLDMTNLRFMPQKRCCRTISRNIAGNTQLASASQTRGLYVGKYSVRKTPKQFGAGGGGAVSPPKKIGI